MDDRALGASAPPDPAAPPARRGETRAPSLLRRLWGRGAIRTLRATERDIYLKHLLRLGRDCRRSRFHRFMSDDALALHADRVFADPSIHVIGWFLRGRLRGAAEVAVFDGPKGHEAEAAFAVEAPYRRRRVGGALMRRAALWSRNRRARRLHIATHRDNRAMLRLATAFGAAFQIVDAEAEGVLTPGPRTLISVCLETWDEEVGLVRAALEGGLERLRRRLARLGRGRTAARPSA